MSKILYLFLITTVCSTNGQLRSKRAAYQLADGAELLINPIQQTFTCQSNGYYADVDNNCQLFHICHSILNADGSSQFQHHSFFCGNGTVFNQLTFTCTFEEDAVPCESSPEFFYLNENLGIPTQLFLTDNDIEKGNELILKRKDAGVKGLKEVKDIKRVTSRVAPRVTPTATSATSEPASDETPVILLNQVDGRPQENDDLNTSSTPRIQNIRQAKNGQGRRPRRKNQRQNQRN